MLPICQRYGIGTLVWSSLAQGLLTGRDRTGQQSTHRSGLSPPAASGPQQYQVILLPGTLYDMADTWRALGPILADNGWCDYHSPLVSWRR